MKALLSLSLSVRTKVIIALGLMLLPLLGLAIGSLVLLKNQRDSVSIVSGEIENNLDPITNLQVLVFKATYSPHHYLIFNDTGEQHEFECATPQINQLFTEIYAGASSDEKRDLIVQAKSEWRQIENANKVLFTKNETGAVFTPVDMDNLHFHIDRLIACLDQLHELAMDEVAEQHSLAHARVDKGIIMVTAIIGTGLFIAITGIFLLVRSILIPLKMLGEGAENFGRGNFSHRVPLVSKDEMGELAITFNAMADSIKANEEKLRALATHDGLTNLYNHREFQKRLKAELDRSNRYGHSLALLMLDIDHFKAVNDTYGHQGGDEVLRAIGSLLNSELRTSDFAARYGGEEFALILPETTARTTLTLAERIRMDIAALPVRLTDNRMVNITVSIGVALFPEDTGSQDELIAAADRALYAAKRDGRNRICRLTTV